ncbi:hypothetical protein B0H17DRAFT_1038888 [Mycena rosella]|uniref:Uncharacterized protein n=1 Tax=Mycena rosella TaxID=1033263 RepID=A0AAD7GTD8_MYCRO|nr:hypothetical protein B0H17DRAFT_1038888 [Mycena rosella]
MALVLSHAPHLKHLNLTFPSATLRPLFILPAGSFPRLETLWLQSQLLGIDLEPPDSGYCGWHWPGATAAFKSAPCLREVIFNPDVPWKMAELRDLVEDSNIMEEILGFGDTVLDEVSSLWSAPMVSLPWAQIRVLSFPLTAYTPDVWCSVLAGCPNVECCQLAVSPGHTSTGLENVNTLIHLLRLHQLVLFSWNGAGDQLLGSLVAPKLELLVLTGHIAPSTIRNFRIQSNFDLRVFGMMFPITQDDVELLFQALSDITALVIAFASTEHFPASIWDRVGRAELLPRLETLVLQPRPGQMSVLVDMIAASWDRAATLGRAALRVQFLRIRPDHLVAVNEGLKGLEKYAAAGNNVEFTTFD